MWCRGSNPEPDTCKASTLPQGHVHSPPQRLGFHCSNDLLWRKYPSSSNIISWFAWGTIHSPNKTQHRDRSSGPCMEFIVCYCLWNTRIVLHMHNISNLDRRPYRVHFLANKTTAGSVAWSSALYSRARGKQVPKGRKIPHDSGNHYRSIVKNQHMVSLS